MEMLRKDELVFANDGTKPLPMEVELVEILPDEKEKRRIKIFPALPEEWTSLGDKAKEMSVTKEDFDGWMIVKYISEPALTLNDVKFMKPIQKAIIARTILAASGFPLKQVMEAETKEDGTDKAENGVLPGQEQ